jgi:tetratricopeptide (TPR) repeat protein
VLADPQADGKDGLELFGVSRICERRGDVARARKHYAQSLDAVLPAETDRAARRSLARLAKREGDLPLALKLWESILGNSREGLEAYQQLAIHYEHQAREPQRAAVLVRKALAELRPSNRNGGLSAALLRRYRGDFERRLQRLDGRVRPAKMDGESLLDPFKTESRARD